MTRLAGSFLCALAFLVPLGCSPSRDDNLVLKLPESVKPPAHAPERLSYLKIDGKDYTEPRSTYRMLKVEPKEGNTLNVEYTFWLNTYTQVIRTRQVTLESGRKIEVDLTAEDPNDKIRPIFFPTPDEVVDAMCKLGKVSKGDVVYDIGCGDGRMVIHAVKEYGAKKGVGIDINEDLVRECRAHAKVKGVSDQVEFRAQDCQEIKSFAEADVVLLYLSEALMLKLRPIFKDTLKPGSRIVSHRFLMGDWKPDQTIEMRARNNYGTMEDYTLHVWHIQ